VVSVGSYSEADKSFHISIKASGACKRKIPAYQMVFHKYRVFYFLTFLTLGFYCTFFGMRNIRLSLKLIGFSTGFWLLFSIFAIVLFKCRIIRPQFRRFGCYFGRLGGRRLHHRLLHDRHGTLPHLHFQWGYQWSS